MQLELFAEREREIYRKRDNMCPRENNSNLSAMIILLSCCATNEGYIYNQVRGISNKLMRWQAFIFASLTTLRGQ